MINPEAMAQDLVFVDPSQTAVPESQRYFKVLGESESGTSWTVSHIASGNTKVYTEAMLKNIEPVSDKVFCEVDFTPLLGEKVSIEMSHGRVSGRLTEVRCYDLKVFDGAVGVEFSVPATLILGGDMIPVAEIRKMEVL